MNTCFDYILRDASNYKERGDVTLQGEFTEEQAKRVVAAMRDGEFFIPDQVGLPELSFGGTYEDDDCWHEAGEDSFSLTSNEPDDGRTVEEFVQAFEKAAKEGWKEYDVVRERFKDRFKIGTPEDWAAYDRCLELSLSSAASKKYTDVAVPREDFMALVRLLKEADTRKEDGED